MVEKLIGAIADYLKFTFGVMLLATVALFLYASIRTGNVGAEQFHFLENTVMLVVATKILSSVLSSTDGVVGRLRDSGAATRGSLESLSFIEKMILSVASVFLSVDLLMVLLASLLEHHKEGVGHKNQQ
jgi:hypothetical protein